MLDIAKIFRKAKIVGIIRTDSAEKAIKAAKSFLSAGFNTIEFTMTTPDATTCIREIKESGNYSVGMGSVNNTKLAKQAIDAGADFIVCPHLDKKIINLANDADKPVIPGVATPTEIIKALRLGASVVKVFPSNCLGGINYIKALFGPYPDLNIFATGGIRANDIKHYLNAGALCIGIGGEIFKADYINNGQFDKIYEKAIAVKQSIEQ